MLGTALGCSIAVFSLGAPGTAWAVNECGVLGAVGGVDQPANTPCLPGNYPSGITYNDPGPNPVMVTLGSGADPIGGVFVEDQGAGAYARVTVDLGAKVYGSGVGAYTTGGGNVFVNAYGTVYGNANGIFAAAINGGNVYVDNTNQILAAGNLINARTSGGSFQVYSSFVGEGISIYTSRHDHRRRYAYAKNGTVGP